MFLYTGVAERSHECDNINSHRGERKSTVDYTINPIRCLDMTSLPRFTTLSMLFTMLCSWQIGSHESLHAEDKLPTFTTPENAGPDYLIQGEYTGKISDQLDIAAQVIASGDGQFEGVLYGGGLPGAGWDGITRFHFQGRRDGATTKFLGRMGERLTLPNPNFQATLKNGVLRGMAFMFRNLVDKESFEMTKIHRRSPTEGAEPPSGAIVLFDGSHTDEWIDGQTVDDDLLDVGTTSRREFRGLQLHLEFRTPFMPSAQGMARGNSGVYIKREWEIQVLDSFGWNTENRKFERLSAFGRCGGIHELIKPRVNMCLPPLAWQTYDIEYLTARFDDQGNRICPALMTVRHNGVLIHDKFVLPTTPSGTGSSKEQLPGSIYLQDHGNPVRYRNVWVVELPGNDI